MANPCPTIAVLYFARNRFPLRLSVEAHLRSWERYSGCPTFYINAAMNDIAASIEAIDPDIVIADPTFLGVRWHHAYFQTTLLQLTSIISHRAVRIALPQDEYYFNRKLREILSALRPTCILSCAEQSAWPTLYGASFDEAQFRTVLTGYVDDALLERAGQRIAPASQRPSLVSYRASNVGFWLGCHGRLKVLIAEKMRRELSERGYASDIVVGDEATISGRAWLDHLGQSRAVLGVEGGASVLDQDGEVKRGVETFLSANPNADFEQVYQHTLRAVEIEPIACISPRHFEAAAMRCAQILLEGSYNGILKPGQHYLELKRDFSNIDEVISLLQDDNRVDQLADRTCKEIVLSERFTYRAFVTEIVDEASAHCQPRRRPLAPRRMQARFKDWMDWRVVQAEVAIGNGPRAVKRMSRPLRHVHRLLTRKASA